MTRRAFAARLRVGQLFDVYGRLLTDRQQRIVRLYYLDDLSLGEIAERLAVTRQAVSDALQRASLELERVEGIVRVLGMRHRQARYHHQLRVRVTAVERLAARLDGHLRGRTLAPLHTALLQLRRTLSGR